MDPEAVPVAPPRPFARRTRVLVALTALVGLAAFVATLRAQLALVPWLSTSMLIPFVFAVLLVAGELKPLVVAREDGETDSLTVSTTFAVALVLSGPLVLAMLAQGLAVAFDDLWRRHQPVQAAFNVGQYVITILLTRVVFCQLTGHDLFAVFTPLDQADILPSLVAGATFFLANNGAVALVISSETHADVLATLAGDTQAQGLATAILMGLAPVLAIAAEFSLLTVPLIVLPLVGVQHSAFLAARRQHEALHDGLTGLPNRTLLHRRTRSAIETAIRTDGSTAVLLLDLDHFKEVNDTLGHHVGDGLLQEVARRVVHTCPPEATVGRLGGDEFAVLLPAAPDARVVGEVAQSLSEALREPAVVDGVRIAMQSSIGVALAPEHAQTVETVFQRADIALYRAKEARGAVEFYRPEIDVHTVKRLNLFADLHAAVAENQLHMAFQPILRAGNGHVVSLEALLRWSHPTRGEISPEEFIPLAESSGVISAMSRSAITLALGSAASILSAGHDVTMAVNLSARLLCDLELPAFIEDTLRQVGVPAVRLTVEVTESTIAADPVRALQVLHRLRELGVHIAVDDFGTGYSSLSYLSRLRPDELKVDRSFVGRMATRTSEATIVKSTIELGHALGMSVTAEGVEDAATYQALVQLGADRLQGYYIARPMPEMSLYRWLIDYRAAPAVAQ